MPPPLAAGVGAGLSAGASEESPPENSRKLKEVATIATTATTAISASQNRRRRAAVSPAVSGTAKSSGRGSPGPGCCEPSVIVTSPRRCPARPSSDQRHIAELPVPVLAHQIHPHHMGDLAGAFAG